MLHRSRGDFARICRSIVVNSLPKSIGSSSEKRLKRMSSMEFIACLRVANERSAILFVIEDYC